VLTEAGIQQRHYVDAEALPAAADLRSASRPIALTLQRRATAQEALSEMLRTGEHFLFIEDDDHRILGGVDLEDLFKGMGHDRQPVQI